MQDDLSTRHFKRIGYQSLDKFQKLSPNLARKTFKKWDKSGRGEIALTDFRVLLRWEMKIKHNVHHRTKCRILLLFQKVFWSDWIWNFHLIKVKWEFPFQQMIFKTLLLNWIREILDIYRTKDRWNFTFRVEPQLHFVREKSSKGL